MKELLSNKATVLQSKKAKEVDDHKTGKKKATAEADHHATLNTEHGDLLSKRYLIQDITWLDFRTGFIEREFRQRSDAEKSSPTKRETRPRDEKTEGQEKTEEQGEKVEGQQEEEGEKKGRTGGYKGDNRGGRGGKQGGRGGYKGNYNPQVIYLYLKLKCSSLRSTLKTNHLSPSWVKSERSPKETYIISQI